MYTFAGLKIEQMVAFVTHNLCCAWLSLLPPFMDFGMSLREIPKTIRIPSTGISVMRSHRSDSSTLPVADLHFLLLSKSLAHIRISINL